MANEIKEIKKPEETIRVGCVSATIWKNVNKDNREYLTATLEKNYKDKSGKWQKTSSFSSNDIPKLVLAAQKAYEHIMVKSKEDEE